jgi:hypothetical protein
MSNVNNQSEVVKLADVGTSYDSTADTKKHIAEVVYRVNQVCSELMVRAKNHDKSKLASPEKETFDRVSENLRGLTYGSAEYNKQLEGMNEALQHHYSVNRHHPNHWAYGINGMSLLDLIEMLADWKAAGARHADGSMRASLDKNRVRFNIPDELYRMLERTCHDLGWL